MSEDAFVLCDFLDSEGSDSELVPGVPLFWDVKSIGIVYPGASRVCPGFSWPGISLDGVFHGGHAVGAFAGAFASELSERAVGYLGHTV